MMQVASALTNRPIAILWSALLFSAMGDELYAMALIWTATETLGRSAGMLVAAQAAVALLSSLSAGIIADRSDPRRLMILADLIRLFATLLPPLYIIWAAVPPPLYLLIIMVIVMAAAKPYFDPALQACLPRLATTTDVLQAVNGLFDAMRRLARIIGPSLASVLLLFIQIYQFFTLNAISFLVSTIAVASLRRSLPPVVPQEGPRQGPITTKIYSGLSAGFRAISRRPAFRYHIYAFGAQSGAWYLGLVLATALRVRAETPDNFQAYGLIVASYGVGNVLSNLIIGEIRSARSMTVVSLGRIISGCGFLALAYAHTLPAMMIAASIAACGAPITQVPLATIMQTSFSIPDIPKVYRVRMVAEWAGVLTALLASPLVFHAVGISGGIAVASAMYLFLGTIGFLFYRSDRPFADVVPGK